MSKLFVIHFVMCVLLVVETFAHPMMYKKAGDKDIYEPDLVAVSSTVIPLAEYQVIAGIHEDPNESYKKFYMKHFHKKVLPTDEDPDTLITLKKKFHEKKDHSSASVKSVKA